MYIYIVIYIIIYIIIYIYNYIYNYIYITIYIYILNVDPFPSDKCLQRHGTLSGPMSIIKPRLKRPATRNVPWPVCRRFNCKLGTQSVHWLMIVQEVPCPCHLVILGSTISNTSIQKTTRTNLSTGEPMGTNCYFYWKGIHFTGLGVQNAPHRLQGGQHVRIVENVFVQEPHRPGHFLGLRENTSIVMGRWWSQWMGLREIYRKPWFLPSNFPIIQFYDEAVALEIAYVIYVSSKSYSPWLGRCGSVACTLSGTPPALFGPLSNPLTFLREEKPAPKTSQKKWLLLTPRQFRCDSRTGINTHTAHTTCWVWACWNHLPSRQSPLVPCCTFSQLAQLLHHKLKRRPLCKEAGHVWLKVL